MKKLIVLFCSVLFIGSVLASNAQAEKGDVWEEEIQTHKYICAIKGPDGGKNKRGIVVGSLHIRYGGMIVIKSVSEDNKTVILNANCRVVSTPLPEPPQED